MPVVAAIEFGYGHIRVGKVDRDVGIEDERAVVIRGVVQQLQIIDVKRVALGRAAKKDCAGVHAVQCQFSQGQVIGVTGVHRAEVPPGPDMGNHRVGRYGGPQVGRQQIVRGRQLQRLETGRDEPVVNGALPAVRQRVGHREDQRARTRAAGQDQGVGSHQAVRADLHIRIRLELRPEGIGNNVCENHGRNNPGGREEIGEEIRDSNLGRSAQ